MGFVAIPSDPEGHGRLSVVLDLSRTELELTIEKLKTALSRLRSSESQQQAPRSPIVPTFPVPLGQSYQQSTSTWAMKLPQTQPDLSQLAPHAQQGIISGPAAVPVLRFAELAQPTVISSPRRLPIAEPSARQQSLRAEVDVSLESRARPAEPSPAEDPGPEWKVCWSTDGSDHSSLPITSLVYGPTFPGLPGGDGHAGWLISASRQLLNLWECSASGGRGEPSLQFMHQQTTETVAWNLAPEPGIGLLLAAAQNARRPTSCIALHSLHAESGIFAPRGRMPMPPIGPNVPPMPPTCNQSLSQVVSLHPLGGPLTTCCAASFGGSIVVYPTTIAPGEIPKAKAVWTAHRADVTSLHRSLHGMQLFSGAHDGSIHTWDLKAKPSKPSASFRHNAAVTGLNLVNERHLVSCSMDGQLFLWDVRRTMVSLRKFAAPDGSGITKMAVSPFGESAAFGTAKGGLFSAPVVLDEAARVTQLPKLSGPVGALAWNTSTGELYAACQATITVLQPVL